MLTKKEQKKLQISAVELVEALVVRALGRSIQCPKCGAEVKHLEADVEACKCLVNLVMGEPPERHIVEVKAKFNLPPEQEKELRNLIKELSQEC